MCYSPIISGGQLIFYGENIFRVFQDNSGGIIRLPEKSGSN